MRRLPAQLVFTFSVIAMLGGCGGGSPFDIDVPDIPDPPPLGPTSRVAPAIALSDSGYGACVWKGDDHVYAESYTPVIGWSEYERLDTGTEPTTEPEVSADPNGNAVVVWEQAGDIVATRFDPVSGWEPPTTLSGPGPKPNPPQVASGGDGSVLVVWERGGDVEAARFDPVDGWGPPMTIAQPVPAVGDVEVALGPSGDAVVVWEEGAEVVSRALDPTTETWSPPEVLGVGDSPKVACDGAGGAVAVFESGDDVVTAVRDPVTGWEAPAPVPVPAPVADLPATNPAIGLNDAGQGVVAFILDEQMYTSAIDENVPTEAAPVSVNKAVGEPEVGVDDDGNAIVVYESGFHHVEVVRFRDAYDQWLPPVDLGTGQTPVVDANDDSEAIIIYTDAGVIGATFVSDLDPTIPRNITVELQGLGQVVSTPEGISAYPGAPAEAFEMNVPHGTFVNLEATPAPGYVFSHWADIILLDVTSPVITVEMLLDQAPTAVFVTAP